MKIGSFFWPYTPALCETMARYADDYGYDMIGVADTPGNAMDPWVAAALVARLNKTADISICVTNFVTRHASVSAAAIASLEQLAPGRTILGVGAGHSGTKNLGARNSTVQSIVEGVELCKTVVQGRPFDTGHGSVLVPWVKSPSRIFMASSHPKGLEAAGRVADGVIVNYGLHADNVRESEAVIRRGVDASGRSPGEVPIWQVAGMDCTPDGDDARRKSAAVLPFAAGYIVGDKDPATRGVPEPYCEGLIELRRRYSTRPGQQNADLIHELGLFDYLSKRLAILGTPEDCFQQTLAAADAGIERLMFSVSVTVDPAEAVRLYGEQVLPRVREALGARMLPDDTVGRAR